MSKFCIIESEEGVLPDYWDYVGVNDQGRRITEVFEDWSEAHNTLEDDYGMYISDAQVELIENLRVSWL